jgi:hypothetical protein
MWPKVVSESKPQKSKAPKQVVGTSKAGLGRALQTSVHKLTQAHKLGALLGLGPKRIPVAIYITIKQHNLGSHWTRTDCDKLGLRNWALVLKRGMQKNTTTIYIK